MSRVRFSGRIVFKYEEPLAARAQRQWTSNAFQMVQCPARHTYIAFFIDTNRLCYRRTQSRYRLGRVRAQSNCSIGSTGASEQDCTSITPLGKHFLQTEPHFDVLVIVSETAEPKRHPQSDRLFCLGSAIASRETGCHLPPSRTFTTKRYIAFGP